MIALVVKCCSPPSRGWICLPAVLSVRWLWLSKMRTQNGTLINGTKDYNLRSPGGFILTHTQITVKVSKQRGSRGYTKGSEGREKSRDRRGEGSTDMLPCLQHIEQPPPDRSIQTGALNLEPLTRSVPLRNTLAASRSLKVPLAAHCPSIAKADLRGSKLNHQGTTGFSHCFHLPIGCHLGYLFLACHSHV